MLDIEGKLKWVSSLGGPLILMGRDALVDWNGDLGHDTNPDPSFRSDYDRAGEIEDYVGTLILDHKVALVLGDLPSHTAYIPIGLSTFILVRWIWAENEEQVIETLRKLDLDQPWTDTSINIRFESGDLVLFDSVYSGSEISDSINVKVGPETYNVSTLSYQPSEQVNLFLIKLEKVVV